MDEHRPWSDMAKRFGIDHVAVLLEETGEWRIEKGDPLKPFDRRHPVPPRHDQPKRTAVLSGDRLSFHEVSDEHLVAERHADRQRTLVADPSPEVVGHALVGTAEEQLDRPGRDRDPSEEVAESGACPRCRPDGAEAPLLAGHLRVEESPSVAGALERDDHRARWQSAN